MNAFLLVKSWEKSIPCSAINRICKGQIRSESLMGVFRSGLGSGA